MNRENHRNKDLKNTYLWVNREGRHGEKYEEMLLYKQSVPELVTFYETEENGDEGLVYILDFRQSFLESLSGGRMNCLHIETFIRSLVRVMNVVDEYLLEPSNLVLEMDYIYGKEDKWAYIYIPGYEEDFWHQMEKLSEEWLNYVDYENEKAVLWAYTFYQKVHCSSCSIEELTGILKLDKTVPPGFTEEKDMPVIEEVHTDVQKAGRKRDWNQWVKKKVFGGTFFKNKKDKRSELEFYAGSNKLEDTCPAIQLPESCKNDEKKSFTLIPVGDNELSLIHMKTFPALIGRAPEEVDICLKNLKISRIHARMERKNQEVRIVDMSSANGTYCNGERLKPGDEYVLQTGDILKLADLEFICQWC